MPQAFDAFRCDGCAQHLTFDEHVRVPDAQLRACQGRCDWVLIDRPGHPAAPDPG